MSAQRDYLRSALGLSGPEADELCDGKTSAQLDDMLATVRVLEKRLRPGVIANMARTPSPAARGMSMLQAMRLDPTGTRRAVEAALDPAGP